MTEQRRVKISRYLAKHLRHEPGRLGVRLGPGGWVPVDELLVACREKKFALTLEELEWVVAACPKGRYSFDSDRRRIRANYGHSVEFELELELATPPAILFHGTTWSLVETILAEGLMPMTRNRVHLSADTETALQVGRRHGPPVVLDVDAQALAEAGGEFHHAGGPVWLTDQVPPQYLCIHQEPSETGSDGPQ